MGQARLPWRRRAAASVFRVLERLVPATPAVVVHSQPDLDDNVVALLRCRPPDLTLTVLVDDRAAAARRAQALGLDVPLLSRRGPRGAWRYLRARVCVTTHGLYGSPPRHARHVVNLWHGEFGKLIGSLAGEPRRHVDWMPVSGQLSRLVRSAEFGIPPDRISVVGTPRQSLLVPGPSTGDSGPAVVWAPTYRRTDRGRARVDGSEDALTAGDGPRSPALLSVLDEHEATLWFRPHPADSRGMSDEVGGRVRLADDAALQARGTTFYELLASADVLVTDYSSIWVDWLLTQRPAISFCPDLTSYRSGRGLVLEPHEAWFPGPVVTTSAELAEALDRVLGGDDPHAQRRAGLRAQLHARHDRPATEAVWAHVHQATGRTRR